MSEVSGRINSSITIQGVVTAVAPITGVISAAQSIGATIAVGSIEAANVPHFAGPYEVTP